MTLENVLWIALSAALAFGLAWFSYFYKSGNTPYKYALASLRFLGLFGALLLLVPLQLEKTSVSTEPHRLMLVLDNSASAGRSPAREELQMVRDFFQNDPDLSDRFDIETYAFGAGVRQTDSLDFSGKRTDISTAIQTLSKASLDGNASLVLVTDGIQNQGRGITSSASGSTSVFPIIVGDTTAYRDIRIDAVNCNRYAFLENQYPIEILISYRGEESVLADVALFDNGRQVHKAQLRMSAGRATERISVLLTAENVGFHTLTAEVSPFENERNTRNNRMTTGIEVIDETTRVSIVSALTHPDIGTLSRSVESNEQRQVTLLKPEEAAIQATETDLWIFYQPDPSFKLAYETIKNSNTPLLTIAGDLTNWNFLNGIQQAYILQDVGPAEELLPEQNASFAYFDATEWDIRDYPPLSGYLGEYQILQPNEELLGQRVRGISLNQPLMSFIKGSGRREAVIFGSGIWKWRMQAYSRDGNFQNFDSLFSKLWLFLGAGKESDRLNLEYESLFDGQQAAVIRARFFDEALRFDPTAQLSLQLKDSTGTLLESYPMALGKGEYQADISNLSPGTYVFEVRAIDTDYKKSGQFRMQEFDLENQQVRSDPESLSALAESSGGGLYFPSQVNSLKDNLMTSDRFRPLSRSQRNVVSLIDFRWLLALVVTAFSVEWFLRKYNGLL